MKVATKLTIDEWDSKYLPINNKFDDNASFNGAMFETYGRELDYVIKQGSSHIWTLIDDSEGDLLIVNGYHLVNRIGYFITKNKWEEEYMEVSV
jgi:hypothetical protein